LFGEIVLLLNISFTYIETWTWIK